MTALFDWIAERFRDAFQWPINLVRDFPIRIGRLLRTIGSGLMGIVLFAPQWVSAMRQRRSALWLRYKMRRLANGLHQFVTQLFDLIGGPEIAQFFMHLVTRTTVLDADEVTRIASVLGPQAIRFGDVRVAEGGLFDLVFRLNGNLAFATWHTINLPRTGRHTRQNFPIVIHELTHVFQYEQVGTRYLGEAIYMLIKTRRDCYNYGGTQGLLSSCDNGGRYRDFNREQQAKITQDYFYLREKGEDVTAYEPFILQVRAGEV